MEETHYLYARKVRGTTCYPKKGRNQSSSPQGLHNALEMPRVGMAVAIPSTLNTLLQTLSCTAFAIASAAVNQQPEDPGPRVVGAKLIKRAAEKWRDRSCSSEERIEASPAR